MISEISPTFQANFKSFGQNVLHGTDTFDSEQLYCLLGLLILEGRIPDPSDAGRKPGPHAHYSFSSSSFKNHVCDQINKSCTLANHYREKLSELSRRGHAVSIEVWLLPDCHHYDDFMQSIYENDSAKDFKADCPIQQGFLLIEEWQIKLVPRRKFEGPIQSVTTLLRTITSYLHSSKLSLSLLESKGTYPKNIYYKVYSSQNTFTLKDDQDETLYKSPSFPSIAAGETNILSVFLRASNHLNWNKTISCEICQFEKALFSRQTKDKDGTKNSTSRSKLSTSSSTSSVSSISQREKSMSESQDKRRGFTLPLNTTKVKQQIISPMVVCTDQSEHPPIRLFTHSRTSLNLVKDVTPYPKFNTVQDMTAGFSVSSIKDSAKGMDCETPSSKLRRKSEARIILTDSSSCESIDKCHNQIVLPMNSSSTEEPGLSEPMFHVELKNSQNFSHVYNTNFPNSSKIFNHKTGLPLQSSPAPVKKYSTEKFFSEMSSSIEIKHNKSTISVSRLAVTPGTEAEYNKQNSSDISADKNLSSSAPVVSSQKLLVNFEESMLNMRIHPMGVINGFEVELGASGSFNPKHVRLPLVTYFFQLSDDNAPSPYLGFVDLQTLPNKRGYQVPKKGSIQLTLFNPNGAVIKMFVVLYNLSDMPPNHKTFLRQRTIYMPVHKNAVVESDYSNKDNYWSNWTVGGNSSISFKNSQLSIDLPSYLRYLVHLKLHTSKSSKLYLHTDIRLIFSRDKFEFDPSVATYELRSFVDPPPEPKYSPKN